MELINKKTLDHLAKLARVELRKDEEEKLIKDLSKILDYFNELQELDTSRVAPMAGGTDLKNVFRNDELENPGAEQARYGAGTNRGEGTDAFPEQEDGFLKIPPVFE